MATKIAPRRAKRGLWTPGDLSTLKKLFSSNPTAGIARKLGRPLDAVKKKASRMRLRKAKSYMKSIGRA